MNSIVLIVASYFVGTHILAFFGISLPVAQLGGGLVLASTGWAMLKQKDEDTTKRDVHRTVNAEDLSRQAFYPLTLPLIVGPGSISVAITLGANEPENGRDHRRERLLVLCVRGSPGTRAWETAMSVIMRLSSFLLVCIGVQIIWHGVSSLLASVPGFAR
jgi:multiple antibiotic resistance protein